MSVRIFLSAVSNEFRAYRDQLRSDLTRHNVEVKVQEDFKDLGGDTLDKLDVYIGHCDAVVHLAGSMTGAGPGERELRALLAKYPGLDNKLPPLGEVLKSDITVSYTQWEAWLALYHGKRLFIAKAAESAARDPSYAPTDVSRAAQAMHLACLKDVGRFPGCEFTSPDNLAKHILSTAIVDLLAQVETLRRQPRNLPSASLALAEAPRFIQQADDIEKIRDYSSQILEFVRGGVGGELYRVEQREIKLQLENLGARVTPTGYQSGPDISVTLPSVADFPKAAFQVQSSLLSNDNLRLRINHLKESADRPTVPIWWDAKERKAYWADPSRVKFRTGNKLTPGNIEFDEHSDLQLLDARDKVSKDRFLKWIRALCKMWRHIWPDDSTWPANIEFPVSVSEAIEDPDILMFLPICNRLVDQLSSFFSNIPKTQITRDVLSAARHTLTSPEAATEQLLRKYHVQNREIFEYVRDCFSNWRIRIPTDRQEAAAKILWAYDQLLAILGYRRPGDLRFPPFRASFTYPLGKLISLLPYSLIIGPLERILSRENNCCVLQYAAYCAGILNYPVNSDYWRLLHKLGSHLQRRTNGKQWLLAKRQLKWAEAQTGSEEAHSDFIRKLSSAEGGFSEAAYNLDYYEGNPLLVQYRFEQRLEEGFKTDEYMRPILLGIYDHIRMAVETNRALNLRPEQWQVR
jgi:hypothetical protein